MLRRRADGATTEVLGAPWNARTAVHEYGGGAWWVRDGVLWFADWATPAAAPASGPDGERRSPLTPEPTCPAGLRYADGDVSPDGSTILCVQEDHTEGDEAVNTIVRLAADAPSEPSVVVVAGPDFVSPAVVARRRRRGAGWSGITPTCRGTPPASSCRTA